MPDPLSPVGLLVRSLLFGGLLAVIGATAFRFAILVPLARKNDDARAVALSIAARAARIALAGAIIVLVAAFARLALQLGELRDPVSGEGPGLSFLLLRTTWGRAWLVQAVLAAAAIFVFHRRRWTPALLVSLALAFTPAFSGHAFGGERLPWLAVVADGLHMLGAGGWIGAMLVLGAGLTIPRHLGHGELALGLVAAFSPLALGSAATVAVTGAIGGVLHVGSLQALASSRYGRTLLIKVGMVLAVVALGAFNWKRAGPIAIKQADERPMLRSIRAELLVGLLVLLATAVLVVTPPPGEE